MAALAILAFGKVSIMAEDDGRNVFKAVLDVFSLHRDCRQHGNGRCKEDDNLSVHRNPP